MRGACLSCARLHVTLLPDPHRARFRFECTVEQNAGVRAAAWHYDIPADRPEVENEQAWDGEGKLATRLAQRNASTTRMEISFRAPAAGAGPYTFCYEFDAPVRAVAAAGPFSRTIAYSGWVIFRIPCRVLRVSVALPARSAIIKTVPGAEVADRPRAAPEIGYRFEKLRPLEAAQWLVGYRGRKLGVPLAVWLATQLTAGVIGWLVGAALSPR
ncbi:MAG TPA: hypothetical protein VFQ45_23515 [Longimicrobium sp.]|nr:hypothetical protein [Longimicrobium sp.]